jgi:hypothetical protein
VPGCLGPGGAAVRFRLGRFVLLAGGLAGAALFAAWGLSIDARTFLYDFAEQHVIRRLVPSDVRWSTTPGTGTRRSRSVVELADRYGVVFVAAGAAATLRALGREEGLVRASGWRCSWGA